MNNKYSVLQWDDRAVPKSLDVDAVRDWFTLNGRAASFVTEDGTGIILANPSIAKINPIAISREAIRLDRGLVVPGTSTLDALLKGDLAEDETSIDDALLQYYTTYEVYLDIQRSVFAASLFLAVAKDCNNDVTVAGPDALAFVARQARMHARDDFDSSKAAYMA